VPSLHPTNTCPAGDTWRADSCIISGSVNVWSTVPSKLSEVNVLLSKRDMKILVPSGLTAQHLILLSEFLACVELCLQTSSLGRDKRASLERTNSLSS